MSKFTTITKLWGNFPGKVQFSWQGFPLSFKVGGLWFVCLPAIKNLTEVPILPTVENKQKNSSTLK